MGYKLFTVGHLTDEHIAGLYKAAERIGVGIALHGNTPAPDRSSFTWGIEGGFFAIRKFVKILAELR